MLKKLSVAAIALVLSYTSVAYIGEQQAAPSVSTASTKQLTVAGSGFNAELIKIQLGHLGFNITQVNATEMPGLVEVVTDQGLFYTSHDGKFLIQGKLYGLGENVRNITEESLAKVRMDGIKQFKDDMIVFPAKNEKHVVTIFTDITCGYCRKLHEQMDDYNDKGITVRYLAYPRAGVKDQQGNFTQGYKDLLSIWCHEDPNTAMTKAKAGSMVAQRICDKPIEAEFNFGRQIGVSGTPAIITDSGFMMPGYREPDALLQILENL